MSEGDGAIVARVFASTKLFLAEERRVSDTSLTPSYESRRVIATPNYLYLTRYRRAALANILESCLAFL